MAQTQTTRETRPPPPGSITVAIDLPTLHDDQVRAFSLQGRFKAVRAGRRWGKTKFGEVVAADAAARSQLIGWFAPEYKFLAESYLDLADMLQPLRLNSQQGKVFRTKTGGQIDFWSLENPNAGRGRRYHKIIIDEAAFAKDSAFDIWRKNIAPTLLDFQGSALVLSNTNGADPGNFFWRLCNEPEHRFVEHHAPTMSNPTIPYRLASETDAEWQARRDEEFERIRADNHPLVYQQEYLAEFVDWSGAQFFSRDDLLIDGQPVPIPERSDAVFATIDTAVKTGREHDSTAVSYWAVVRSWKHNLGYTLVLLDWDITKVEGALLETWLPNVFRRLEEFAKGCKALSGSLGAWIEDKASGTILLQQARRRGWPAHSIESKLTEVGKDERAISVSGYVFRKQVKVSKPAFEKTVTLATPSGGQTRNHWLSQVLGYRVGQKDMPDDLLDTMTYGIAISMGNQQGY